MAQNKSRRLLWAVCLAALAAFAAAMVWLHYQQLCSPGGGSDPYTSDLGMHLAFAQRGMVYSTVSLLIGPAYALAGRIGIAVLLAAFHLAAVAVFACGLMAAVILNWNVDLSKTRVEILQREQMQELDNAEQMEQDIQSSSSFEQKGTVYEDPETGKLYVVMPKSGN